MHTSTSCAPESRVRLVSLPALFRSGVLWSLTAALAFFGALDTQAKIGAAYQLLLGNPSNAVTDPTVKNNYLIVRDQFAISYNDALGQPNWVSWNLTQEDRGNSGRTDAWSEDPLLPAGFYRVQPSDYNDPGLSRGHMCPSADRTVTVADNTFTFLMSNMVPQTSHNNGGVWNNFEIETRNLAAAGNEVMVISGPSGFGSARIASNKASIPAYVWKVVVVVPVGPQPLVERITTNTRVIAIKVPNVTSGLSNDWREYLTSVNQIQQDTGFTFFTTLPSSTASVLRTMIDGQVLAGAPIITEAPAAQSVAAGGTATFNVTATGDAPLNYQWSFEGQNIGTNSSTLTVNNVGLAEMGHYRVTVSNNVSTTTSEPALLVVTGVAPSFLTDPVSQTVNAGSNVVFTALAAGSPTMTYQWRKDTQPIDGATSATLTLNNVQAGAIGSYDVIASNDDGEATSAAATLSVTPVAPTITVQPASRSVGLNGTATFSVTVVGTEPFTYVWRKGGTPIPDNASAATATLVLPNASETTIGDYDVVISNSVNTVTSETASLTISSFSDGALNYTGGTYSQDFDSLNATQGTEITLSGNGPHALHTAPLNAAGLEGWTIAKHGGSGSNALFKVDHGGQFFSGAIYSYGASGSSDRALGSLGSGSTQSRFAFALNNNTGQTLTEFTISYVGEQWRDGTSAANTLSFSYAIDPTDLNVGNYVAAPSLSFTSPNSTTNDSNGIALDGNAAINRREVTATVTGVVWPAGSRLIIRWTDVDDLLNDDGLAIDDFVFTAQNAGPVAPVIVSTSPADEATGISPSVPITITFNQPVTLASDWFTLTSAAQGALTANVSGGPTSFTLTPTATLPFNDTITVTVLADRVTDTAIGTLHLSEDYSFEFVTIVPVAPTITAHPATQSVTAGSNVTFTVAASGTAPFTYVWKKGTETIANATSATLTLNNVQPADAGSYSVVVSNAVGSATSNGATLTVNVVTTSAITWNFTTADPSSALPAGIAGGTYAPGNNFGTNDPILTNSTSSGYVGASGGGNAALTARIGALVKDANGSAYVGFTLTAAAGSRIYVSGIGFGSRSTGTGPKAYALYTSLDNYTTPLASGTMLANSSWAYHSPTFIATNGPIGGSITFRLYGFGNDGTNNPTAGTPNWRVDDLALTVAVQDAPSIGVQPTPQTTAVGGSATFSVTATGSETLTYQWRKNGDAISTMDNATANTATLTIGDAQSSDAGSYDVVVTNAVASVTSNAVTLTVETPPAGGFASWRAEHFSSTELEDPAISGPNAVLTSDGLTNFLKYALGLPPRVAATAADLPQPATSATHWTYTFTRPIDRDDVVYDVQASTNLTDWTTIMLTVGKIGTEGDVEIWRAQYPLSSANHLFFRLKVSTAVAQ